MVLAAGGFERNAEMRRQYLPRSHEPRWSGSQPNNTGDAIRAAMQVGAATLNMDSAWWGTSMSLPGEERARLMAFERALPGAIIVNANGERYMNEAASYHIAGQQMIACDADSARTIPSWMVFDAKYRASYPVGPVIPDFPDWMQPASIAGGAHARGHAGGTRAAHAAAARAPARPRSRASTPTRAWAPILTSSAARAPTTATTATRRSGPNPTLRALETPPYYAIRVYPGDIGTNGGLATNENAQVLDEAGASRSPGSTPPATWRRP